MAVKTNWYKWSLIIAAAIIILLIGCNWGKGGNTFFGCNRKPDTLKVSHDTSHTITITTTIHKDSFVYIPKYIKIDTPIIFMQHVDSLEILKDYLSTIYYDTTINLKRGTARITDTVTQNRIAGEKIMIQGVDTTIRDTTTITTTVTLQAPKRLIVYFDLAAFGNRTYGLNGVGTGLSLKGKTDVIYGVSVNWLTRNKPEYGVKMSLPIRLKKGR